MNKSQIGGLSTFRKEPHLQASSTEFAHESSMQKSRVQHCSSCKNHGVTLPKRNHKCHYQNCKCILCELLQRAQKVMRHQQRVWRHQKLKLKQENGELEEATSPLDNSDKTKCQVCDKCRNHNKLVPKRNHQCVYAQCSCVYCNLTSKRRDLMKYLQRVRRSGIISEANPDVIKARKFLEETKSQFEFGDDESGGTDEDEPQDDNEMEETSKEAEKNLMPEESVSPSELQEKKTMNPKKQRLLNFREEQRDCEISQSFAEFEASLDLSCSPTFHHAPHSTSDQFSPNPIEEHRVSPLNLQYQRRETVSDVSAPNPLKLYERLRVDSSPPPLIDLSSTEGEISFKNHSLPSSPYYTGERRTRRKLGYVPSLKRFSVEDNSYPAMYQIFNEHCQNENSVTKISQSSPILSSPPPKLQSLSSPTNLPLYVEASHSTMQTTVSHRPSNCVLSSTHLQNLNLQYALLMRQQMSGPIKFGARPEDMQLRNSEWACPGLGSSIDNFQGSSRQIIRPLPVTMTASHPYNSRHEMAGSSHWNPSTIHYRPSFTSEMTGFSLFPPVLSNEPPQKGYLFNPF